MMLSRCDLHPYQDKAVEFVKYRKRCALLLDLGLGKTPITLTAISDLQDGFVASNVLIIAPLRVANSVWPKEPELWAHLSHLKTSVVTGTARNRLTALHRTADIYVINRENVVWLVEHYGDKWPFDMVVVDESSSFKAASSKRWKALKRILPHTEHMVLLTGTPAANGLLDVWAQSYLIDSGASLGKTMTGYKKRFFESDFMGYNWSLREGSADKIHALMRPYCLSMSAEDYLELPERIDVVQQVELAPKVMAQYQDFESTLIAELDDGEEVEAVSAAVLANKLLQFSNGSIYTDEHGNWTELHKAKIDAMADIADDNADENMLVAYNYKADLARLQAKFPHAVTLDKNPETIDRWNRGEIKMLLAHPASAAHGINLQQGGCLCVWFSLNWSLELYQQFNGRLHRQGQMWPVRIVHIVAAGCIDERVMSVLADKHAVQADLLKTLK